MAHDVLWLSMCIDHPDEIAVHMEDGRNPDGSEAGNTGSSPWPCSCRASPSLVSSLGLARFWSPVSLSTPPWRPELASLLEVVALSQLALPEVATQRKRYLWLERERLLPSVVIPTDAPLVERPA